MLEQILVMLISGVILFQLFCAYKLFQYKRDGRDEEVNKLNAISKITQLVGLIAVFSLFIFWRSQ